MNRESSSDKVYDPKKHRRRSIRLKEYDYSSEGMCFVTVRVRNGECVPGEVVEGKMYHSEIGRTVDECWDDISTHFANTSLDVFQVMPNHLHGILLICDGGDSHGHYKPCKPPKDVQLNVPTSDLPFRLPD